MKTVPNTLRTWFIIHFIFDIVSAIPLMIAPVFFLQSFGWEVVDPITARLVAAALFGIGIESWLGRNADADTFKNMLNLKIIWSAGASIGICWSLLEMVNPPIAGWVILGVFIVFHGIWWYWRRKIN